MNGAPWQRRWADYYEVLGIPFGASPNDVRKAYRTKAWLFHPDVHREKQPVVQQAAAREFAKVQEAYECLIDVEHRSVYDRAWVAKNLLQHVRVEPAEIELGEYTEGSGREALVSFTIHSDIPVTPQGVVVRFVPSPPLTDEMILEIGLESRRPDFLFPLDVEMAISTAALRPGDIWTDLEIEIDREPPG